MLPDTEDVGQDEEFRELVQNSAELTINVGIINSVSSRWPEDVQRNWLEKIELMNAWINDQVREVQEFASALD